MTVTGDAIAWAATGCTGVPAQNPWARPSSDACDDVEVDGKEDMESEVVIKWWVVRTDTLRVVPGKTERSNVRLNHTYKKEAAPDVQTDSPVKARSVSAGDMVTWQPYSKVETATSARFFQ
jgi:hypothetical protein